MQLATTAKSYAKGGPKSKRKKPLEDKFLKQARVDQLSSPVQKVAQSVNNRRKLLPKTLGQFPGSSSASPVTEGYKELKFAPLLSDDSDDLALLPTSPQAARQVHSSPKTTTLVAPVREHLPTRKKRMKQSVLKVSSTSAEASKNRKNEDSEEEQLSKIVLQKRVSSTGTQQIIQNKFSRDHPSSPLPRKLARSPKDLPTRTIPLLIESDDSEEDLVTPHRRRKHFMPPKGKDSDEDVLILPITASPKKPRDLDNKQINIDRSRKRSRNSEKDRFRSNLQRLRRKKQGLASHSESERVSDDNIDDSSGIQDDNEQSFIVEGETDDEMMDELPDSFQQPRSPLNQFKISIQWEILDLLMPQGGFEPDRYFKSAITWLMSRTQDKGQASLSSIWRPSFTRALQRGPLLEAMETGNLGYFCDACGRTNRIATYVVKFEGDRYDRLTLEDLDSDADSSEDDLHVDENAASDAEEEKARQERIMRQEWNLGVNCYERTCVAHELFHLRKHLRIEVYEKLQHMGLYSAEQKYARSIMPQAERMELANQITEQLDQSRFPQRLWTRFKSVIERGENYIVGASRKPAR